MHTKHTWTQVMHSTCKQVCTLHARMSRWISSEWFTHMHAYINSIQPPSFRIEMHSDGLAYTQSGRVILRGECVARCLAREMNLSGGKLHIWRLVKPYTRRKPWFCWKCEIFSFFHTFVMTHMWFNILFVTQGSPMTHKMVLIQNLRHW